MKKREFVKQCAASTNLSQKQVTDVLNYLITTIIQTLCEKKSVKLFGLGKLKIKQYHAKKFYNFHTGEISLGDEYYKYKFEPGVNLQKKENNACKSTKTYFPSELPSG